jgi:Ni/Fe-hydrogenase subunit HybB-like protein
VTRKLRATKAALWLLTAFAAVVGVLRMARGLGATTALTDLTPWGFWIGFDVMGGVALAAGGFVIAGSVYVLRSEALHPIVRPAVLTAFLGYAAVVVGLLFDLGRPYNIWRMTVHWQPHSALFEVGWCVMLYLTVLALEFAPVVLEKFPALAAPHRVLKKATPILVVIGIMLSTLHQSSLGTLILIMPFRVHPLWYTPWLPILFFVTAIGLGLCMVIVESSVTSWLYDREPETALLARIARPAAAVLFAGAALKFLDLAVHGKLGLLLAPGWETAIFWLEWSLSALVPASLLAIPAVRRSRSLLLTAGGLSVVGFVFDRLNVAGISMVRATGTAYVPSLWEVAISVGIVAGAALVFFFFVERLDVYHQKPERPKWVSRTLVDPASQVWPGTPRDHALGTYSAAVVIGVALALASVPAEALTGAGVQRTPMKRARGMGELLIEGTGAKVPVVFPHADHMSRVGGKGHCGTCHHMNKLHDEATPCSECHQMAHGRTDIFDHAIHVLKTGENSGCARCHEEGVSRVGGATVPCPECHKNMLATETRVKPRASPRESMRFAPGFVDAMHALCVDCHREHQKSDNKPDLSGCATCHRDHPALHTEGVASRAR